MTRAPATSRWRRACGASAGGTRCRPASRSSATPRQKGLEPVHRRLELVALDGAGGIDVLRADLGALADEGAAPDAGVLRQHLQPGLLALVARVEVVAL